jgi:hypothetical protein
MPIIPDQNRAADPDAGQLLFADQRIGLSTRSRVRAYRGPAVLLDPRGSIIHQGRVNLGSESFHCLNVVWIIFTKVGDKVEEFSRRNAGHGELVA